ncbi:MAG: serine hydroxymethyltransferase, partial [Rhodobacteraceae bacterium]|nr:serine hydroxymethyltransferase [Paracoccaceae bacterium]
FDVAKSAALAVSLLDWREHGKAYADAMVALSRALAEALSAKGLKIFAAEQGFTRSHQFAIEAAPFGGGQVASHKLRKAGFLACGIGLPIPEVAGDLNGLRIGTPELVRRGVGLEHVDQLASLIAEGLTGNDPASVAPRTATFRAAFTGINYIA